MWLAASMRMQWWTRAHRDIEMHTPQLRKGSVVTKGEVLSSGRCNICGLVHAGMLAMNVVLNVHQIAWLRRMSL